MVNELIYDIDSDEQHIEALLPYSLEELTYVSNCIQVRIPKIKSKCFLWGGGKTAIISILCLSYSAICIVNGGSIDGILLGRLVIKLLSPSCFYTLHIIDEYVFKQKLLYLQNLKMIIDMTIKIKRNFT